MVNFENYQKIRYYKFTHQKIQHYVNLYINEGDLTLLITRLRSDLRLDTQIR